MPDYPRQCETCNAPGPHHCNGLAVKCQCSCGGRPPHVALYRESGIWFKPRGATTICVIMQSAGDSEVVMNLWDAREVPEQADIVLGGGAPGWLAWDGDRAVIPRGAGGVVAAPVVAGLPSAGGFVLVIAEF